MKTVSRKIGDKTVTVGYDEHHKGGRAMVEQRLNEEEAAFVEACETADKTPEEIAYELFNVSVKKDLMNQEICSRCGHKALKERRSRIRVLPWGWGSRSEHDPYMHCSNCGHDQETSHSGYSQLENFIFVAQRQIERAKRIRDRYTNTNQ